MKEPKMAKPKQSGNFKSGGSVGKTNANMKKVGRNQAKLKAQGKL